MITRHITIINLFVAYIAIAYYYDNKVTIYDRWMTNARQRTTKVKTQILLNDKNQLVAFGDNAKIMLSTLK